MRQLRTFALRNYLTLAICTIAAIAFLASGLRPVSGSKDLSKALNGSGNSTVLPVSPDASAGLTPSTSAKPNERSDAFNERLSRAGMFSPPGTTVTATKTDNTSAAVNPGDTIMYTVVITNTGALDATNVIFTDTVDSNTTLVAGSINSSPVAFNDTYTATGNIPIAPAAGVLVNDIDPDTGTNAGLTVTQVQGSGANVGNPTNTTATGIGGVAGSVSLSTNGSFTYEPPPGFTGADTFTYQISDAGGKTGVGTVTINVSNMVWFIDNTSGAANSRGTFSQPFKTIAAFNAVNTGAAPNPQNGNHVVLRPASGSYAEVDGINLRDSQTLTGPAVAFNTVFTADANSTSAYNTFAGSTGTAAAITATAGNGVDLGSGNAVRGFNVGNTPGFFGFNGTAVGALTVATVSKTGTGGAMSVSTSGTFASTVNFGTFESSSSASSNLKLFGVTGTLAMTSPGTGFAGSAATFAAIDISGGSVSLTYTGNVTKATTGALLSVAAAHSGTLTFNTGTLNASAGTGLQFDNSDGSYNFNGTTTLNGGDAGIDILNGSGGTFNFGSSTTITSPSGTAFNVGTSPGAPTVTYSGSITQNTSGQRVINIDTTTSNTITFQTGTITGGASSTGININAANGNVTFSNGMTMGTSGSRMTNQAVTITGGTGTYSLGAVSIFTSTGKGIGATNADGTINCTGTVDSGSGSAIDINGPAGLTALNISLTKVAYSGGTNSGISLQKTSGSFTITGTGSAGTGGTLQSSTSANGAIFLSNVTNIDLSWMIIQNNTYAIIGTNVGGFSLSNCSATGNAGTGSAAIFLTDTTNAVTFLNDTVTGTTGTSGFNVDIHASPASTAAISTLTVTNGSYSNSAANGGFLIDLKNTASIATASFTGVTFSNNFSKGLQIQQNDNSVIGNSVGTVPAGTVTVTGCTFSGNNVAASFEGGTGAAGASGSVYYRFVNNGVTGIPNVPAGAGSSHAVIFANGSDSGGGTYKGFCSGNTIGNAGVAGSGSGKGNGIRAFFQGQQAVTMTIVNNTIRGCPIGNGMAIQELGRPGATFGQTALNIKITGNDVNPQDSTGFPLYAIYVGADAQGTGTSGSLVHAEIHGNTVPTPAGGACDTQCGPTIGMIAFETVNNASGTTAGTLFQTGPGGTVSADIAATNTGTAGKSCAYTNPDHLGMGPGGGLTFGAAPATVSSVHPVITAQSIGGSKTDGQTDEGSVDPTRPSDLLLAARGQAPPRDDSKDDPIQKLTQAQLNWMVQAALGRWIETGISAEDLARLQAATFDVAGLPAGQLASVDTTHVTIDEIGAGYGWFFDQSPIEDSEFQVQVPDKELQTAYLSPARGKMDLLTVVMRELGYVYIQGKTKLSKSTRQILQPMMDSTLSPGVRRLPLGQWKITPPASTVGKASPTTDTRTTADARAATQTSVVNSKQTAVGQAESKTENVVAPAARGKIPAGARHAVFNPATDIRTAKGAVLKFNNARDAAAYAAIRARRAGSMTPFSGGTVTVNGSGSGFTIPVGKSVTIMFNVTVNAANTFPPGTTQVCNQGSVSGSNFTTVQTDDPDVAGTQSTCTALNVADLSVTKAAGSGTTCSTSNIVYTIGYHNAGPANALGVVVSDAMPAGTSLVSAPAPANWSRTDSVPNGGNGTIMFSRTGASTNGESATFTVTVSVDGTVADGAVLSNTASVSSTTPDPDTSNNTSSPATTVTVKKPPTTATVGGPQTICALGTTTALGGNTPTIGTGTWTVQSGGTGTFNPNATTPGATFTHLTGAGPVVLRWTISNPPCADSFAEVTVTIRATPTATVGGPQTICALGTTTSLGGNTPTAPATGLWTIVTAGVTGTFNPSATTPGATFTHTGGAIGSTATLRWTVSNAPCTDATADVVITIKSQPTATAGGLQTICAGGTTAALGGNTPPTGATGTWSIVTAGVVGTFNPDANTPGATFTHTSGGVATTITLRWTVTNAPCTAATADVDVIIKSQPVATAGGPQTICQGATTATLGGNTPPTGATGTWSIVTAGVVGTFNPNATTPGATFTHTSGAIGSTATLRWTVSNAPCSNATADVVITIKSQPTATAGGPQTICSGGTTASLGGNTPPVGATGTWSIVTAGITGTFNPNATTPGATFTHSTGGTTPFTLRWTVTNAPCTTATADVTITLQPAPVSTNGGPQTICDGTTTASLGGNTPAIGETGAWSIVTGGATGTFNPNATTPGATFTPTSGPGVITLRWTVTNATCGASVTSDAVITVKQQPTATVGGPQTICALGTTASLGGNTPAGGATGTWSIVTAGQTGTFNPNATTPSATFTHATGAGPITLRWTVSNAPCTSATADVVITITQPPTTATVGGPQTICDASTTTSLGGNTPTSGSGLWTIQTGGATGTFNPNAATPGATFTPTSGPGTIVLRWTISSPPCTASFAEVTITVKQQPTATVGGPQTICALGTTASLGGNNPAGGATGTWTVQGGGTGTFNPNANSPTATFTHTSGTGPITLRWTVTNAPCTAATADVIITITQSPTTATVGGPQTICALSTTAGLGGNTPTSGTGTWTVQSGGAGTFNPNANTGNATFTHTSGTGPIVVRWTIASAPCPASFAEVTITITQSPTTATVGGPQTICALSTTAGLGGNTPTSGAGTWTVQSGGTGTFNPNANTGNATFTHTSGTGPIVLRWTIANAPCPASFAEVTITITQSPTTATVGGPQTICALSTTAGLGGNTPTSGVGTWTVQSGGTGTFNPNANTGNATFTHTSGTGPIVLRWTIASAPCPSSFAEVTITISQQPTTATVGGPQTICASSTTASLGGNTPTSGTGAWTQVSGPAGTFNPNAAAPGATFTAPNGPGTVVVRWTISSPPCPDSFAEVTITVKQQPTATTGGNQTICALSTSASLGGNTPAGGATGLWTIVTGGATGTFNPNATTPGATFTHTGGAGPITLRWTVSNAPCTAATADVILTITPPPTTATAGGNQTITPGGTTAPLGGNSPVTGMGSWSIVTAGFTGTFNPNATTPNATWTHLTGSGQVVLRWTISNAPCPPSTADVTIQIGVAPTITCPSSPVVASATTGQCQAAVSFTVTATGIPTATVACTPPSGSTFPVGNTTVNCTAMNGVSPNAMCSFTVQVNDTQPPVFTSGCPAAINTAAPATCPFTSSGVVTYPTPAATDNCPGVTVACNPPSGGMFPVGTTTVTCTATDASNNTTQCTFPVTVASLCVQDDTNPGNVVLVNVNTGGYRFCCNGVMVATATSATVTVRGCVVTITDTTNNRNVQISIDGTQNKGSASIRIGSTMLCTITDRKLTNNTCVCN